MRFISRLGALALIVSLSACDREATGQVVAVVNGEEITLQEVNAEIGSAGVPEGGDRDMIQRAALQRVIERRLLAQVAQEDGLDETPDYVLRERQLREALLVQLLGQRAERSVSVPEEDEIAEYIAENPALFSDRKIYTVDRILFPIPGDFSRLRALQDDHSMQEVEARLRSLGIEFERGQAQIDSAALGQQRLQRIRALPEGEPFVIPENGMVTIGVITGERSVPVGDEQARQIAAQYLRNNSLQETIQQRLSTARSSAEIEYQDGFAPPTDDTATPSATKQK